MHYLVCLIVVFTTAAVSAAAPPATIEIVLDASASMNRPGPGGSPIHAVVRESMEAVIAETEALRPDLQIGLRFAGGDRRVESLGSCSSTSLALPPAELDKEQWALTLDAIEPWGLRPLIASVLAALVDLDPAVQQRRIVIVTSGGDQGGLGPQQVASALAAKDQTTELRLVGLGLDQETADRFGAVPRRNATTPDELVAALRWAILDIEDGVRPTGSLLLEIVSDTITPFVAEMGLFDLATGAAFTKIVTNEARFDLPVGSYRLVIVPEAGATHEFRDLLIPADGETKLTFDLSPAQPVTVDVGVEPVLAGALTWIDIAGFIPEGGRLLFVDANGLAVSRLADPLANDGWITSPPLIGPLDLILVGPVSGGVRRVLARRPIIAVASAPELTGPDEVGINDEFTVGWSGSQNHGDFVGLVARAGASTGIRSCAATGLASEARLMATPTEAELDLIYVTGATMSVTDRRALQVTAPIASITVPARISPGEAIEVAWTGPENDEDFLSLAVAGSPDDAYVDWARVEEGNPASFRAPESPGSYEVRYVEGRTGEARARAFIEVEAIAIELTVPKTAAPGMRIEVQWTGPGNPGDFLAIAPPGSPPKRFSDWSPTTVGSPLTLAAPTRPGTYEIRYFSAGGRKILARATLEIGP